MMKRRAECARSFRSQTRRTASKLPHDQKCDRCGSRCSRAPVLDCSTVLGVLSPSDTYIKDSRPHTQTTRGRFFTPGCLSDLQSNFAIRIKILKREPNPKVPRTPGRTRANDSNTTRTRLEHDSNSGERTRTRLERTYFTSAHTLALYSLALNRTDALCPSLGQDPR
jgi:hypothetical protein